MLSSWNSLLLALVVFLALARESLQAECFSTLSRQDFSKCVVLLDGHYALHWAVNNDSVTFGVQVDQTTGWFALGLSEGGGMKGADVWVFSKNQSSDWQVTDRFSQDYVTPVDDVSQDIALSSTSQTPQSTSVVFTRKLDTCDGDRDQVIYPQYLQPYIVAFSTDEWGYHGPQNRETQFLVLDGNNTATTQVANAGASEEGSKVVSFLMPNITIPPEETSYLCTNFETPRDKRYQIIAGNYTITPNKMVHHMILYACYRKPDVALGKLYECGATPPECAAMYLVWVPGTEYETMPPSTGFPFGKGSFEYMMLQVHYTNPEGKTGVKDSSGMVATYTSNLRPNDLAVLWLGAEGFTIPPGQEAHTITPNVCPSECTSKFTSDLNLVASEFHMHQTGAKQSVQRLRRESRQLSDGAAAGQLQEIVPLNYREYYDFNWQGATFVLPGGETLERGETLITTCTYNTMKRTNVTTFGLSSYDEMCYNFVRYWPAQKIDRCITLPGSEVNGTALATCASQIEYFTYMDEANITFEDFANPDTIKLLMAEGFIVSYNTSQYEKFVPYNRTTAECAAVLSSRQQPPQPPAAGPVGGPAPSNVTSAAAQSLVAVGFRQCVLAAGMALVLMSALML